MLIFCLGFFFSNQLFEASRSTELHFHYLPWQYVASGRGMMHPSLYLALILLVIFISLQIAEYMEKRKSVHYNSSTQVQFEILLNSHQFVLI